MRSLSSYQFGQFKNLNRRAFQMLVTAAVVGVGTNQAMATSTYIGPGGTVAAPTSGDWNTAGNWSPTGVPASSFTTELDFRGTSTYTATDDIAGVFDLNILKYNGSGSSIAANSSSSLLFGGTNPTISQLGTGIFTISAPVAFGANVSMTQVNGGETDFTGNVTTSNGSALTLTNSSGTGNSTVKFTGSNTFAGLTVNSHVTALSGLSSSTTTLGTGTVTLAGGFLRLQGQQSAAGSAVQAPIGLTGFNGDLIGDAAAPNGAFSSTGTPLNTIDGGNLLYQDGYMGTNTGGIPANGIINSALPSKAVFDLGYNGSSISLASNNALYFTSATTQGLTLTTPERASTLQFLAGAQNGVTFNVQINFSNGTTSTYTSAVTTGQWASFGGANDSNAAFVTPNVLNAGGAVEPNFYAQLCESDLTLTSADQAKTISSIYFTPTTSFGNSAEVYAISGDVFGPSMMLGSQTYANNVNVTANSDIDVSGSLNATMGNVSIGAVKLSVTSADTTTSPYSLTLGSVTLTGTGSGTTSFDVSNSSGGGAGTLTLGALNDNGTAQSITFNPTGTGTIILGTDATSLVQGTQINILNGTVQSNSANAMGSFATVNLSSPGTLMLGASQQISALNGTGGTVNIGGNSLTIGNSDNLNSTFGGLITGSGTLTTAGSGTVSLSGANTYGGANVNSNGQNISTSTVINSGTVVAAGASNVSNGAIVSGPLGTGAILLNSGNTGSTTLYLDNTPGRVLPNSIFITSSGPTVPTLGALNTTGVTTFSGNVTLGTGSTGDYGHNVNIAATSGGELDFTGNILSNAGNGHSAVNITSLTGSGNATVRFTGSNTYAGGTTINPYATLAIGPTPAATPLGSGLVTLAGGNLRLQGVLASGMQQTAAVSGYNADTILDNAATTATMSSTGTATSTIDGGNLYYESGYAGVNSNGLPTSGTITSASTGHVFQLGSYTDNNTLRFTSAGTGQTLSLATPGQYQTLDFLVSSQNAATFSVTLNFSNSTSATIGGFSSKDWYGGNPGYNAVTGLNPVTQASGSIANFGGALTLQEYDLAVPTADQGLPISSITFTPTAVNGVSAEVYAISGATAAPATPLTTQTYANAFNVTANSAIDVSGSLNASIGALTIGSQTLTVTSADTTGSAYSLTAGPVTFVGSGSTFNVSNSASNGAGTLVLGSINDGGAAQNLIKTGSGTLVLGSPATTISDPSVYNILGGTLAANDPDAITANGVYVAITIASGATFSLGANQQIGALNDNGTPTINGSSVVLNGNTLTVGSNHDYNSSFSGVISDGTGSAGSGGLVKTGAGTLTLYGASTFSGPTTVNFGTLTVANTTGSATGTGDVTLAATSAVTLASGPVGSIAGNVSAGANANIQPGGNGSIGTLSIGGLTTDFDTDINFDLGTGSGPIINNGDLLNIGSGAVNLSAYTLLTFGSSTPSTAGIDYRLIGGSGVGNINTSSFVLPAAPTGVSYSLSTSVDPGYIDLVVTSGTASGITLLWNNSNTNTNPPGDGVTWANTVPGDTSQNWNSSSGPSGFTTGDAVLFTDNNNGHYNVNIASNVLPSSITVNSAGNYNFSSSGGFAIGDSPAGPTPLTQSGGGLLTISNVNTFTGPTSISGAGTTLHLTDTGKLATASVTIGTGSVVNLDGLLTNTPALSVSGMINLGASDVNNDPTAGFLIRNWSSLNVSSGASVNIKPATSTSTRTVLVTSGLSLATTGKIDLSNNDMIIHNGNLGSVSATGSIANEIQTGYNAGKWNAASGITSSTAATKTLTALGYAPGGNTFDGMSTTSTDVLVKYTYYGDANLDGKVDGSDYSRIDNGALNHLTGWYNGDFNYDGVINGSDYTLIDNAYNTQGASLAASIAAPTAQVVGGSSVPEPASLALLGLTATGLLGRRRRIAVGC
jgi:fibronectin-binding autotransporter adhesin